MSLSTWFRDYLYFPLGGSRVSEWRTKLNVMIVFLVSGLWHGANLTFVLWGGLNGTFQVVERTLKPVQERFLKRFSVNTKCFSFAFGQVVITFALTCFAWIFFRAPTIEASFDIVRRMFTLRDFWKFFDGSLYSLGLIRQEMNILLVAIIAMVTVDVVKYVNNTTLTQFLESQNTYFQWLVVIAVFMYILVFGVYGPGFDASQFIYFQF